MEKDELVKILLKLSKLYFTEVLGFCIMGNHLHLLVRMLPEQMEVSVSDPTAKLAAVQVTISDGSRRSQAEGKDTLHLTFDLPTGMDAGKSLTQSVPR